MVSETGIRGLLTLTLKTNPEPSDLTHFMSNIVLKPTFYFLTKFDMCEPQIQLFNPVSPWFHLKLNFKVVLQFLFVQL